MEIQVTKAKHGQRDSIIMIFQNFTSKTRVNRIMKNMIKIG